jgi:hypothetical protein
LAPGERVERGFFGWFEQDHPAATSSKDLAFVDLALALPEATPARSIGAKEHRAPPPSLFCSAPLLDALELNEADIIELFGENLREAERENGRLLSFFSGDRGHVALKAKELAILRPHGHILRTGGRTGDHSSACRPGARSDRAPRHRRVSSRRLWLKSDAPGRRLDMLEQIEGSKAMARTIGLCRPQVVCAYPITPQTHIVEGLGDLVRTGALGNCEFINVESEFAALSVAIGASAAGARAYTATASQGLLAPTP